MKTFALGALLLGVLGARPASAACPDGAQAACVNEYGCPGTTTCMGKEWSDCIGSTTCNEPPPMKLWYVSSGIGSGREVRVDGVPTAPMADRNPTYLFRQAQKQLTFTATAADSARGVRSVRLQGELRVICMQPRQDVQFREARASSYFHSASENRYPSGGRRAAGHCRAERLRSSLDGCGRESRSRSGCGSPRSTRPAG